ncbi:hypothetical protein DBZ45_10455 [Arthrobacter globiformis]|uniref:Uncharacterized protein n=1 Tax=Arthrobacter globiformis TaxID=1665 RepID=A0A328HEZ8_ARTGO|nr:hypothetical protein DBZ45_10455 [Arthrobacter globiformis]
MLPNQSSRKYLSLSKRDVLRRILQFPGIRTAGCDVVTMKIDLEAAVSDFRDELLLGTSEVVPPYRHTEADGVFLVAWLDEKIDVHGVELSASRTPVLETY